MSKSQKAADLRAAFDRSPSHLIHRAQKLASDCYLSEVGRAVVTERQLAVLSAVDGLPSPTQAQIGRLTGIDRSSLAELLPRLVEKGLVERRRSPNDRRANLILLTAEGAAVLAEVAPRAAAADERLLSLIPDDGRREQLVSLLADLVRRGEEGRRKSRKRPPSP